MYLAARTQPLEYPIMECLERIRAIGFEGVEICLENEDLAPAVLDAALAKKVGQHAKELGLAPSVSYHKDYICDDVSFEETKDAIRMTPEFGAEVFVFAGRRSQGEPDEWSRMIERTRELVKVAEDCGVVMAEEFEPQFVVGSTEDLHRLFEEVPSPNLTANLDLGHVFLCDPDPIAAVASLKGKVSHCHVENMGKGVHRHLAPDEGDMDLREYFAALHAIGFTGPLALDLYKCDYEAVSRRVVPYMRGLLDDVAR
jgi:hydroxypyruvate isomerase